MKNDHRSIRATHWRSPVLAGLAWACIAMGATAAPFSPTGPAPWRCGNAYSDTPCAGGRRIDTGGAPGEAARRAADESTRRIEQRADTMERDRLRAEQAAASRNGAVILPDHRIAEARNREAARLAALRSARDEERQRNRASGQRTGRRPVAAGHAEAAGRRR